MTTTPRLALPLIEPGQAQKEMFHNEALAIVDAALQPSVAGVGANEPPATPALGESWIVGPAPMGAWAGRADALASWTAGGWRFVPAREGSSAWHIGQAVPVRFVEGRWEAGVIRAGGVRVGGVQVVGPRRAGIAAPVGGTVADNEARAAITEILAVLRGHGLISA